MRLVIPGQPSWFYGLIPHLQLRAVFKELDNQRDECSTKRIALGTIKGNFPYFL